MDIKETTENTNFASHVLLLAPFMLIVLGIATYFGDRSQALGILMFAMAFAAAICGALLRIAHAILLTVKQN